MESRTTVAAKAARSSGASKLRSARSLASVGLESAEAEPIRSVIAWSNSRAASWALAGAGIALLVALAGYTTFATRALDSEMVEAALSRRALQGNMSRPAAYEAVRPSVVGVRGRVMTLKARHEGEEAIGTGVLIADKGIILTSLHVVRSVERVEVIFADGTRSEARISATRAEQDLAILQASRVPGGVRSATLTHASDLAVGQEVIAVGYPFGMGPSVSGGVISAIGREHRTADGVLSNLIQFDAAVNPGSSGGPLVTMDGYVVGIVTGIFNPTELGFFVGIGFAVPVEDFVESTEMLPF